MRAQDEVYVPRAVGALPRRPVAVSTHPPPPRLARVALDSRAVEAESPEPAPSHDALYDELLDRLMRGEAVDLAALRAAHPDFPSEWLARLEKMQRTMAGGDRPVERSAPETIGPYRVLETLGEGGMGMVYLAEHPYLQRRVALKVVRPELRYSGTTRARFEREALAVARLKHPHIVTVHDAGEDRGVAYLAMELVEGRGLDEELERLRTSGTRMEPRTVARLGIEMASALHAAHSAGVLHRDLKPGNIRLDREGRALLLDFGLAQAEGNASISVTGHFRGTPAYASPEQVDGATELDARSDVYSLGATLYECLAGRPPFEGRSTLHLFQSILTEPPTAPSKLGARVDADLERIVLRALAKSRDERPRDAAEFERELRQWLERSVHTGSTESVQPPKESAPRRSTLRFALFVAAGAVISVLLAVALHSPAAPDVAGQANSGATSATESPATIEPERAPTNVLPLLGAPELDFGRRLDGWERTLGPGTFGDDEDSNGVVGLCLRGVALKPVALGAQARGVRGALEPLVTPDMNTGVESPPRACGIALEWSNGQCVAVALLRAERGFELAWCALARSDAGAWSRSQASTPIEARDGPAALEFRLQFDASRAQLAWTGSDGTQRVERVPAALAASGAPVRFYLWTEDGALRCARLELEES